jgi:hypothetical protein
MFRFVLGGVPMGLEANSHLDEIPRKAPFAHGKKTNVLGRDGLIGTGVLANDLEV